VRFLLAYHSYRVKYNGLLASRFFSSREKTLFKLALFNPVFEYNSVASTKTEKDETSLQVFLSRAFKLYTLLYAEVRLCQIFNFRKQDQYCKSEFGIRKG